MLELAVLLVSGIFANPTLCIQDNPRPNEMMQDNHPDKPNPHHQDNLHDMPMDPNKPSFHDGPQPHHQDHHKHRDDENKMKEQLEQAIKSIAEFLEEWDPEALEHIKNLRKENKWRELAHTMQRGMNHVHHLMELKKNRPEQYKTMKKIHDLDKKCEKLSGKIRESKDKDKTGYDDLVAELKKALSELFDLREEQRKREIEEMEKRLEEMKKEIKIRSENKDKITEKRLNQLLGKRDKLEW